MKISEKEDLLFAEWREKRPDLVADGIADEQAYSASPIKLLFVLKEVNDPDGGGWDLREFICAGGRPQTWNNITRWTEGIQQLSKDSPWSDLESIDERRRKQALSSIAAINLKKTPGGHTTDIDGLAATATEDREFLNRQMGLYDPDIIICCGAATSDILHSLIHFSDEPFWKMTRRGVWFHEFRPGKYVIRYEHPEARVADCLLYYGFIDAVREIIGVID